MRKLFTAIAVLGLAGALAAPAAAQSYSSRWDGFYGGVGLGYGNFDSDAAFSGDAEGFLGGVFLGYNRDYGDWVVGGEVSYDTSEADFDGGGEIDDLWRLKLRLGRDYGRSLVYGVGGIGWADARIGGVNRSENGWFLGAGIERAMTDRLSIGTEVLYNRFNDLGGAHNDIDGVTVQVRATLRF